MEDMIYIILSAWKAYFTNDINAWSINIFQY
jgi:hypothetical protein